MELQNSKDWAKVYRACNFIEKGVCEYANERVYVSQDALQKSLMTMKGRPVIIDHKTGITPENMQEYAVGYVTGVELNNFEAGCDCQFVIFDDKGKEVIADGYSVSCAYKPIAFGPGGTWHNVPYDREIVELEFTHLALVQNPRYEDAKVYENSKEFLNVKDRDGREGRWITVKGTHVFVKDGQSVEDAMKETGMSTSSTEKGKAGYKTGAHPMEERSRNKIKEELGETSVKYVEDLDSLKKQIDDKLKKGVEPGERRKFDRVLERIEDIQAIRKDQVGGDLEGKYAKEDADFNADQMKKDIKAAQDFGHESIEDVAEFLGLDEDEVRETIGSSQTSSRDEKIEEQLDDLEDQIRDAKRRLSKTAPADRKTQANIKQEIKDLESMYDYKASRLSKGDDRSGSSFDEEGFKKFVEANKKKEAKKGIEGSESIVKDNLSAIEKQLNKSSASWGVFSQGDSKLQVSSLGSGAFSIEGFKMPAAKNGQIMAGQVQRLKDLKKDAQALILGKVKNTIGKQLSEAGLEADIAWDGEDSIFIETWPKEKHNSKEDTMNVEEFFNKMGEIIEEKFNACKGKMNEADEEEKENEDDDKFEMDGEVYSKKELVNAFKEKKNAEDEEEKEEEDEEEEKQNSNDEFFNAMEQRMLQYNKEEGDKVQVYTQQKGLERGKAIYGK